MIEIPQIEEIEEAVGFDVHTSSQDFAIDDLEDDLAALIDYEEERSYNNVVPINDQYKVEDIAPPPEPKSVFDFYDGNDFRTLKLRSPKEMYIWGDGALVKGGLTLFGGVPKVGKSSLLMTMLMSAACGSDFLGYPFDECHKILWFQGELMPEMLKGRYDEAIAFFSPSQQQLIHENLIMTGNGSRQLNDSDKRDYKRAIEQFNPSIIAIDPLRNLISVQNESDPTEMITALSSVKETALSVNRDTSVILVHHLRKISQQTKNDPFDLFSGSGALRGYYDSGLVMMADEQLKHDRHLHWEIRNGKPIEPMQVSHIDGKWEKNGGLVADVRLRTKSALNSNDLLFEDTLISLLKSNRIIGIDKAADWCEIKNKLSLVLMDVGIDMSDSTLIRQAKSIIGVHFTKSGRGKRSKVYYDGAK